MCIRDRSGTPCGRRCSAVGAGRRTNGAHAGWNGLATRSQDPVANRLLGGFDLDDLDFEFPGGNLCDDGVANRPADKSTTERRLRSQDVVLPALFFLKSEQIGLDVIIALIAKRYQLAGANHVVVARLDDLCVLEHGAQPSDLALVEPLLLARCVILRVLAQISVSARGRNRFDDLRALDVLPVRKLLGHSLEGRLGPVSYT